MKLSKQLINRLMIIYKIFELLWIIPFYLLISKTNIYIIGYCFALLFVFVSFFCGLYSSTTELIKEDYLLNYKKNINRIVGVGSITFSILSIIIYILLFIFSSDIAKYLSISINIKQLSMTIKIASSSLLLLPTFNIMNSYLSIYRENYNPLFKAISLLSFIFILLLNCIKIDNSIKLIINASFFSVELLIFIIILVLRLLKIKDNTNYKEKILSIKNTIKNYFILVINSSIIKVFFGLIVFIDLFSYKNILNDIITNELLEKYFNIIIFVGIIIIWFIYSLLKNIINKSITDIKSYNLQKDNKSKNKIIDKSILTLLFFALPICLFIAFDSKLISKLIFNLNDGYLLISLMAFESIFVVLLILLSKILIIYNKYKLIYCGFGLSIILKIIFNESITIGLFKMGLPIYIGPVIVNTIVILIGCVLFYISIHKLCNIDSELNIKMLFGIIEGSLLMILFIILINYLIKIDIGRNILSILLLIITLIFSSLIYYLYFKKTKMLKQIIR